MLNTIVTVWFVLVCCLIHQYVAQTDTLQIRTLFVDEPPEEYPVDVGYLSDLISGSGITLLIWPFFKNRGLQDRILERVNNDLLSPVYSSVYSPFNQVNPAEYAFFYQKHVFSRVDASFSIHSDFQPFIATFSSTVLGGSFSLAALFLLEKSISYTNRFLVDIMALSPNIGVPFAFLGQFSNRYLDLDLLKSYKQMPWCVTVMDGEEDAVTGPALVLNGLAVATKAFWSPSDYQLSWFGRRPLFWDIDVPKLRDEMLKTSGDFSASAFPSNRQNAGSASCYNLYRQELSSTRHVDDTFVALKSVDNIQQQAALPSHGQSVAGEIGSEASRTTSNTSKSESQLSQIDYANILLSLSSHPDAPLSRSSDLSVSHPLLRTEAQSSGADVRRERELPDLIHLADVTYQPTVFDHSPMVTVRHRELRSRSVLGQRDSILEFQPPERSGYFSETDSSFTRPRDYPAPVSMVSNIGRSLESTDTPLDLSMHGSRQGSSQQSDSASSEASWYSSVQPSPLKAGIDLYADPSGHRSTLLMEPFMIRSATFPDADTVRSAMPTLRTVQAPLITLDSPVKLISHSSLRDLPFETRASSPDPQTPRSSVPGQQSPGSRPIFLDWLAAPVLRDFARPELVSRQAPPVSEAGVPAPVLGPHLQELADRSERFHQLSAERAREIRRRRRREEMSRRKRS